MATQAVSMDQLDIYIAVDLTYEEKLMAFDEAIKICTAYKGHLKKSE